MDRCFCLEREIEIVEERERFFPFFFVCLLHHLDGGEWIVRDGMESEGS